jgi:hypothetical protein
MSGGKEVGPGLTHILLEKKSSNVWQQFLPSLYYLLVAFLLRISQQFIASKKT